MLYLLNRHRFVLGGLMFCPLLILTFLFPQQRPLLMIYPINASKMSKHSTELPLKKAA